jgi:hypothetical protein
MAPPCLLDASSTTVLLLATEGLPASEIPLVVGVVGAASATSHIASRPSQDALPRGRRCQPEVRPAVTPLLLARVQTAANLERPRGCEDLSRKGLRLLEPRCVGKAGAEP